MGAPQNRTQKREKNDKSWIFILLLLLGVAFVYFSQTQQSSKTQDQAAQDQERIKKVDSYLKSTTFNVEADRRQRQIEAYQQLNKLHETSAQTPYQESQDFSLESDPYMQSLTQELDRSRQAPPDQATPAEIIQQRLYEDQMLQKKSQAYRQAYAEQFIENARKGGWEVELGPNFEVLSVKKLKSNRGPSLFQEGGMSGAR